MNWITASMQVRELRVCLYSIDGGCFNTFGKASIAPKVSWCFTDSRRVDGSAILDQQDIRLWSQTFPGGCYLVKAGDTVDVSFGQIKFGSNGEYEVGDLIYWMREPRVVKVKPVEPQEKLAWIKYGF